MFEKVYATDLQPARLKLAEKHGAIALPSDQLKAAVMEATNGRGADAALEVVGHPGALMTAIELVRAYGAVSSCGVHTHAITLDGDTLYSKKYVTNLPCPLKCGSADVGQPAIPVRPMLREDLLPCCVASSAR